MEKCERCIEMLEYLCGCAAEMGEMLGRLKDTVKELTVPRVLTMDEVREWKDTVWVEEKNGDVYLALIKKIWEDRQVIGMIDYSHYYTSHGCEFEDYGKLTRYWTRKPTKEQQEETPWMENEAGG
ncbi:MAG: hypothetical protein IKI84_11410 [Clostridia bacterium]|nr:hypothetical protein [Clostridia bacterium]